MVRRLEASTSPHAALACRLKLNEALGLGAAQAQSWATVESCTDVEIEPCARTETNSATV
jgi:hypothetical protein